MCNRYVPPDEAAIERFWRIDGRNQPRWAAELFPRAPGPFLRLNATTRELELVVGQWGLIPHFAKTRNLPYATNNARYEEITAKASYKLPWARGQRCIIPAMTIDEPNWETGKNVWWRFARKNGAPWSLAGVWADWLDKETGEIVASYTMLTVNADSHPIMSRMHKPDPKLPSDQQDKRSVVAIESGDIQRWLAGSAEEVAELMKPPEPELIDAGPR